MVRGKREDEGQWLSIYVSQPVIGNLLTWFRNPLLLTLLTYKSMAAPEKSAVKNLSDLLFAFGKCYRSLHVPEK